MFCLIVHGVLYCYDVYICHYTPGISAPFPLSILPVLSGKVFHFHTSEEKSADYKLGYQYKTISIECAFLVLGFFKVLV